MSKYADLVSEEDWLLAVDGRAWCFGDGVRRQDMLADAHATLPPAEAARHLFAGLNPHFGELVRPGDVVVGRLDFGSDANSKSLVTVLRAAGIGAIIARSFGHLFYKHCLHAGLPALVIEESPAILAGDRLRVDVEAHVVANKSSGDRYVVRNLNDDEIALLRAGSLVEYTRRKRPGGGAE